MQPLHFPNYTFNIITKNAKNYIWDIVRRKYVQLTPEEWVRQHVLHHFIEDKNYNPQFLAVEKQFTLNKLKKRADIVLYNKQLQPLLIVECKAPDIAITQSVFDQTARYHLSIPSQYLMLTNGLQHYYCTLDHHNKTFYFLENLPEFGN